MGESCFCVSGNEIPTCKTNPVADPTSLYMQHGKQAVILHCLFCFSSFLNFFFSTSSTLQRFFFRCSVVEVCRSYYSAVTDSEFEPFEYDSMDTMDINWISDSACPGLC